MDDDIGTLINDVTISLNKAELLSEKLRKVTRLDTSLTEFLEYLLEYVNKYNIPIPKNMEMFLSEVSNDKEDYFQSGNINTDAPSTANAPKWCNRKGYKWRAVLQV